MLFVAFFLSNRTRAPSVNGRRERLEPVDPEGCEIDIRHPPADEGGYMLTGDRTGGQAEMAMSERIKDVAMPGGAADDRQ